MTPRRQRISNPMPCFKGFTLIELLVVIAVISLLVSILLPSLRKAKDLTNRVNCMACVKQIGSACHIYAQDNREAFPSGYYSYPFGDYAPSNIGLYRHLVYHQYLEDGLLGCPVGRNITPYPGGWAGHGYSSRAEAIDAGWTFSYHYMGNWKAQHPDLGEGGLYGLRSPTGLQSDSGWLLVGDLASEDYFPDLNLPHLNHRNDQGGIAGANWLFVDAHAEWFEEGQLTFPLVRDGCVYFLPSPGIQD